MRRSDPRRRRSAGPPEWSSQHEIRWVPLEEIRRSSCQEIGRVPGRKFCRYRCAARPDQRERQSVVLRSKSTRAWALARARTAPKACSGGPVDAKSGGSHWRKSGGPHVRKSPGSQGANSVGPVPCSHRSARATLSGPALGEHQSSALARARMAPEAWYRWSCRREIRWVPLRKSGGPDVRKSAGSQGGNSAGTGAALGLRT